MRPKMVPLMLSKRECCTGKRRVSAAVGEGGAARQRGTAAVRTQKRARRAAAHHLREKLLHLRYVCAARAPGVSALGTQVRGGQTVRKLLRARTNALSSSVLPALPSIAGSQRGATQRARTVAQCGRRRSARKLAVERALLLNGHWP